MMMDVNKRCSKLLVFMLIMLIKKGTAATAPGEPIIVNFPANAVIEGTIFTATCTSVGGDPALTLTWKRGTTVLAVQNNNLADAVYNLNLTVTVHRTDRNVNFTCTANNSVSSPSITKKLFDVWVKPETPSPTTDVSALNVGETGSWNCVVKAYPIPTMYWTFGSNTFHSSHSSVIQKTENVDDIYQVNSTFMVTATAADNNKEIVCVVEHDWTLGNGNTAKSSPFTLTVHGAPTVAINPASINQAYSSDVKITCTVTTSIASYTVAWYKVSGTNNDISIVATNNQYALSVKNVELTIINVDLSDQGSYYCIATASSLVSDKSNTVTLTVYKIPVAPNITAITDKIIDGKLAQVTCISENGFPKPAITWSVVGASQPSSWSYGSSDAQNSQGLYTVTSQLSFVASSSMHQKGLQCTATQNGKTPQTTMTVLQIHSKPNVSIDTPVVAIIGNDVSVTCKVVSTLGAVVTWYLVGGAGGGSDKELTSGADYALNSVILTVKNFQPHDQGEYYCRAKNDAGLSDPSNYVKISAKPVVSISPTTISVHAGSNLIIECTVQPYNAATTNVTWYKLNKGQLKHDGSDYSISGRTLTVLTVALSDEGKYYCKASNDVGDSDNSNTITVNMIPSVQVTPITVNINIGESATFTCSVTSSLSSDIHWYKVGNGTALVAGSKFTISGDTLKLVRTEQDDEGSYYCTATSTAGQSSASNTADLNFKPRASITPAEVGVDAGTSVTFFCNILSKLAITKISWYKTLVASPLTTGSDYTISSSKLQLTVLNVQTKHEGTYYCNAESSIGSAISNNVVLTVKPVVSLSPSIQSAAAGGSATFNCIVISTPSYTVAWYKQGNTGVLKAGSDYSLTQNALLVLDVQQADVGNYYCRATSSAGESKASNMGNLVLKAVVSISPSRVGVKLGTNAKFDCVVVSSLSTSIKWYKDGDATALVSGTDFTVSGNSLIVLNVQWNDQGNYYCEATSSAGTSRSNNVRLDVKPVVEIDPAGPYNASIGGEVTFKCTVTSNVGTTVSWFDASTNQKIQPTTSKYEMSQYNLKILNIAFIDEKSYYCNAKSDVGTSDNSNNVTLQVRPSVSITPSKVDLNENDAVNFTCVVTSNQQITSIQWYKSGTNSAITSGGQFSVGTASETNDKLTISTVKQANAGYYYCKATNAAGSSDSNSVQLNLKPNVMLTPLTLSVKVTDDATLNCSVASHTSLTFKWYKEASPNDVLIAASAKYKFPTSNTMEVVNVAIADEGKYYCTAQDTATGATGKSSSATLSPYKQPSNPTLSVQPDKIAVGTEISASCSSDSGYPKQEITWLKNNIVLTSETITTSESPFSSTGFSVSSILNMTVVDGDKNLTCRVAHSQSLGSSYLTADWALTIHMKPTVSISPPLRVGVAVGNSAEFECTVTSTLDVTVTWFKENTPTDNSLSTGSKYTITGKKLTVKTVVAADEGNYYCKASNLVGLSDPSNSVKLIVKPTVVASVPTSDMEIGRNVTLSCTVTSVSPATVQWYNASSGTVIAAVSDKIELPGNGLKIISLMTSDEGKFFCKATNDGGSSVNSNTIELTVFSKPILVGSSWTQTPSNALDGQTVKFSCETKNGYPKPTIEWLVSGATATGTKAEDVVLKDSGYDLTGHISFQANAAAHNLKSLMCRVTHSKLISSLEHTGVMQIHSKPSVTITPSSVKEKIGNSATLICEVTSTLDKNITWHKTSGGSTTEIQQKASKFEIGNKTLSVLSLALDDEGSYFCKASNAAGTTSSNFVQFTVETPPSKPTIESSTTTVKVNEAISATCKSTANPQNSISFKWMFGSIEVSTNAQLSISSAKKSDRGQYTCIASNSHGNQSSTFDVNVQYKPESTVTQSTYSANVGGQVILECKTNANPEPTYTWTKAGDSINGATSKTHTVTVESGTVSYTCFADNSIGSPTAIAFQVIGTAVPGGNPSTGQSTADTGLSSGAIAAIVLAVIFIILIVIVIIVCCCSHGKCGKKEVKKVRPHPTPKEKVVSTYGDPMYIHAYEPRSREPKGYREPSAVSRTHVDVDIDPYRHYGRNERSERYVSNFYTRAPPTAVESENGTIISLYDEHDQLVSGRYGVLPPLTHRYTYENEEILRKKRRKKKKRKSQKHQERGHQERGTGEGQESPRKEKRKYRREDPERHHSPTRNGLPPDLSTTSQDQKLEVDTDRY